MLTAQIAGHVWHDFDRDGLWQGYEFEYPLAGITVNLLDEGLAVSATTETDQSGQFQFTELTAGTYTLEFELPDGAEFSRRMPPANEYASTVDPATGRTAPNTLRDSDFSFTNAAGLFAPEGAASVSGRVWFDQDGDGVQDQGEPGIAGAEVQLENALLDKLLETYTGDQGNYRFDGRSLFPGDYVVDFVRPPREPNAPKWQISPLKTGDEVDLSLNSDASTVNGKTAPFTLLPGEIGGADVVLDAGFFRSARIEGTIWHDVDRDGTHDDNDKEHGVTGIVVNLFDQNRLPLQTTVSDVEGRFEFRGLSAGDYIVEIVAPEGTAITRQNQGPEPLDSDFDPVTGRTELFARAGSEHKTELAAGIYAPFGTASVVGRVWHDVDGDGLQDPSEPGIADSEVQLENTLFGKMLEVDTDQNGYYRFDGRELLPGSYMIDFKRPPKRGVDARWQISPRNVNNDAGSTVDSDAQPTNGKTPPFVLPHASANATPPDLRRDAGFFRFAHVEGIVWDDTNRDGIRDPLEPSAQGIEVDLLDADQAIVGSVRTGADGRFAFQDLYGGNYTLQFAAPYGTSYSPVGLGTFNRLGSNADPITGATAPFLASSGETVVRNAGVYGLINATSVSGVAWDDVDGDGRRDETEAGMEGVGVSLFDSRSRKVATTLTHVGGSYRFIGLGSDVYSLRFDVPEGSTLSPMNQGGDDVADSDVNRWT